MTLHTSDWIAVGAVVIASISAAVSVLAYRRGTNHAASSKKLELVKEMIEAEMEWEKALSYFREAKFQALERPEGDAVREAGIKWFDQMMEFCADSKRNITNSRQNLQAQKGHMPIEMLDKHLADYFAISAGLNQTRVGAHDRLEGLKLMMKQDPIIFRSPGSPAPNNRQAQS